MTDSTWNRASGTDGGCTNCGHVERVHVWKCDTCELPLPWMDDLLPVLCSCGSRNATLWCPPSMVSHHQVPLCLSCGKPADVEIAAVFRPLTALGERVYERAMKSGVEPQYACVGCLKRTGQAIHDGDFAEE